MGKTTTICSTVAPSASGPCLSVLSSTQLDDADECMDDVDDDVGQTQSEQTVGFN